MKKIGLVIFIAFIFGSISFSQSEKTILSIGEHEYSEAEFWHIYNKNRKLPNFTESPKEFAERFLAYKLKVVEAMSQGMDTINTFKSEYEGYVKELKKSFLVDSAALEKVIDEAVENMGWMVDASHILLTLDKNALPEDTLEVWNKATEIKNIVESGKDFGEVAVENSQDPSVVRNKGRLGYFTAFQMVYPFEKGAFTTEIGKVSEPIRSDFGYHLIFVHDKVKHPGEIKVAHIMKMFSQNTTEEVKDAYKVEIDSIYQVLLDGGDFAELAQKHSGDMHSANSGGEMQPFSLNNMVPEFAQASFALENVGDISEPVLTDFGWHIIKKLETIPAVDPKSRVAEVKHMLGRDGRDKTGQVAYLKNCINSDNFSLNEELKQALLESASKDKQPVDDVFNKVSSKFDDELISYRKDKFSLKEFYLWLEKREKEVSAQDIIAKLDKYIEIKVEEIELRDLADNNQQYKFLANEYYDGLLIFDISEKEIWSQVDKDSAALANFYDNNHNLFMTTPKLSGKIYVVNKKLEKRVAKQLRKNPNLDVFEFIKSKDKKSKNSKEHSGEFDFVENVNNPVLGANLPENSRYNEESIIYWDGEIKPALLIPMDQIRGEVISAYQRELERLWIDSLKEKYKPVFNYNLL